MSLKHYMNAVSVGVLFAIAQPVVAAEKQSIAEFTESMTRYDGYYDFYYDDETGKVYLEVEEGSSPFLFQSSMPYGIGSNDIGLDRGQLGQTRVVQFERLGNKVLLKQLNTHYRASSSNPAEKQSVKEAFASSVIQGFNIVSKAKDKSSYLIDYTPFLTSDIHGISDQLTAKKQGSYKQDNSRSAVYDKRLKAFPKNSELEAVVTFKGSKPGEFVKQVAPDPGSLTVHLHHSLIELPDDDYQPRAFHPYSGFWSVEHKDYSAPLGEPMEVRYIPRHRLNKKNPSANVSEAVEPIVYYLDPGVPEPVKTALIEGASWWNQAFSSAGYKDAFQVKILPDDADPMDVRYNVIQWVHRATRGWSYGASVIDPRTGEILKGHVTLGSLRVRQDLLIAAGLTSPYSNNGKDDISKQKAMALDRIRQLSAHEVGHTLGLAHNFAASVNDRASVMDYPHPLVTLDNGRVSLKHAYDKGIGDWDKYTIAWGYQDYPSAEAEKKGLAALITETQDKGMLYMSDADARVKGGSHSKGHLWDNGVDAVSELNRLMKLRKTALSNFGLNSLPSGSALSDLEERLVPVYLLHRFQVEAAVKLIAGVDYDYEIKDGKRAAGNRVVSESEQQRAVDSLLKTIAPDFLTLDKSLLNLIVPKAYGHYRNRESFKGRTSLNFDPVSAAESAAGFTLSLMLQHERLNRLHMQSRQHHQHLSVDSLISQILEQTIKQPSGFGASSAIKLRVDQVVVEQLMKTVTSDKVVPEVKSAIFAQIKALKPWLKHKATQQSVEDADKAHYLFLYQQLEWYVHHGKWIPQIKIQPLPPGSPI